MCLTSSNSWLWSSARYRAFLGLPRRFAFPRSTAGSTLTSYVWGAAASADTLAAGRVRGGGRLEKVWAGCAGEAAAAGFRPTAGRPSAFLRPVTFRTAGRTPQRVAHGQQFRDRAVCSRLHMPDIPMASGQAGNACALTCCLHKREHVGGAPVYEHPLQHPTTVVKAVHQLHIGSNGNMQHHSRATSQV
jgi:hypothetical protein